MESRAAARDPMRAAAEPPPGAGESVESSSAKSRRVIPVRSTDRSATMYSMIFSPGLKGATSLRPMERTATSISSRSGRPVVLACRPLPARPSCCFSRKYLPASSMASRGTRPTISEPVTLAPSFSASSRATS